jgi:hypothetical protein
MFKNKNALKRNDYVILLFYSVLQSSLVFLIIGVQEKQDIKDHILLAIQRIIILQNGDRMKILKWLFVNKRKDKIIKRLIKRCDLPLYDKKEGFKYTYSLTIVSDKTFNEKTGKLTDARTHINLSLTAPWDRYLIRPVKMFTRCGIPIPKIKNEH